jgi:molybdopterin synthase catalytic subunit
VAELVHQPIDPSRLMADAVRPDCGAAVLFLGTTRDHHEGKTVARLFYEAYEPMALAALQALEAEATRRFEIASCAVVHRLGEVPIREASVAVVVVAPHRAAAFDASRWAMDELKRAVPIWKKEYFGSGGEAWVDGHDLDENAAPWW